MESKERQSSDSPMLLALVVLVALLPLLYVAAIGPIVWLGERGLVNLEDGSAIATAYTPINYVANQSEVVQTSLEWYITFWMSPEPPPQGLHGY